MLYLFNNCLWFFIFWVNFLINFKYFLDLLIVIVFVIWGNFFKGRRLFVLRFIKYICKCFGLCWWVIFIMIDCKNVDFL